MAVNNAFYETLNELTQTFTEGDPEWGIVDYASFIDSGKKIADMDIADVQNGFLSPLMNRIKVVVDTFRSYEPDLPDMYKGAADMGIVQYLTHVFYETRQAPFIGLTDTEDDSMIDFAKPSVEVDYFTETNSWQVYRSITDTELRGAWNSPQAMDSFIQSLLGAVANSNKLHREVARYNLLAGAIHDVYEAPGGGTQTEGTLSQNIDLVGVYNSFTPEADQVTAADCLYNKDFVRWAVSYINAFREWMKKPSTKLNSAGVKTFTPRDSQRLKISTEFDAAIRRSLWQLYYREGAELSDYEVLPYWQNQEGLTAISVEGTGGEAVPAYWPVVCVLYDDYALAEFLDFESTTSERNNKKLYTTYYYNYVYRYIHNKNANFVVFTLGESVNVEPASDETEPDLTDDT